MWIFTFSISRLNVQVPTVFAARVPPSNLETLYTQGPERTALPL